MEHGESSLIPVEGFFSMECSSFVSLKPNWFGAVIDFLDWVMLGGNVHNAALNDVPECTRVIGIVRSSVKGICIIK